MAMRGDTESCIQHGDMLSLLDGFSRPSATDDVFAALKVSEAFTFLNRHRYFSSTQTYLFVSKTLELYTGVSIPDGVNIFQPCHFISRTFPAHRRCHRFGVSDCHRLQPPPAPPTRPIYDSSFSRVGCRPPFDRRLWLNFVCFSSRRALSTKKVQIAFLFLKKKKAALISEIFITRDLPQRSRAD